MSSLALACQCGVRIAPGLSSTRLMDSRLQDRELSAVTRRDRAEIVLLDDLAVEEGGGVVAAGE